MKVIKLCLFFFPLFVLKAQSPKLIDNSYNSFYSHIDNELWISSEKGWNRFRGIDTKHYILNDSISGLQGSWIQSKMFEDDSGNLWSCTYEYLCRFDKNEDTFDCFQLDFETQVLKEGYQVFHYNQRNKLLYLRAGQNLFSYNITTRKLQKLSNEKTNGNSFFFRNEEGRATIIACPWISTAGIEVWTLESNAWKKENYSFDSCDKNLQGVMVSQAIHIDGFWWLISNKGIIRFDPKSHCNSKLFTPPIPGTVLNFSVETEGNLFLTTENKGILVFDLEKLEFVLNERVGDGRIDLESNRAVEIFQDNDKMIWLSHRNLGVQRIDPHAMLKNIPIETNFTGRYITRYNDPYLVHASRSNGICIVTPTYKKILECKTSALPLEVILDVEFLNTDEILVCDNFSIVKLNLKSGRQDLWFKSEKYQLKNIEIFENEIHVVANNKIYRLKNKQLVEQSELTEKHGSYIHDMRIFNEDLKAYVVSSDKLLIHRKDRDIILNIGGYINDLVFDKKYANIFVGSKSGLFRINQDYEIEKLFDNSWELGDQSISKLRIENDELYVIAEKQLMKINLESMNFERLRANFDQSKFHNSSFDLSKDALFLGSDKIRKFSMVDDFTGSAIGEVVLDKLLIEDQERSLENFNSKTLNLGHAERKIKLHYYVPGINKSDESLINYRLLEEGRKWKTVSNNQAIEYVFKDYGEFNLEVQAVVNGKLLNKPSPFKTNLHPPFWETWWFRLISVLMLIGIGFGINNLLVRKKLKEKQIELDRQKALQEQRNRMSRDLHDEMGSGLTAIKYISASDEKEAEGAKFIQIENIASSLIGNMRDLLWSLDESNDTIKSLISKIRFESNTLCKNTQLSFDLESHIKTSNRQIAGELRRNLILIIKEAITNVIKHANAKKIQIDVAEQTEALKIKISDDGTGLASGKDAKGVGIKSMIKRIQSMNGTIEFIDSNPGTTIILIIPLDPITKVIV